MMKISEGDTIPQVTLTKATENGPEQVDSREYFAGRKVALFAVPGAFTPTCSAKHLPGFAEKADELGITPMARIVGQAVSGLSPKWILMTPVQAVQKLMAKVGWTLDDVDLFELNEAFSVQAIAVIRELGLDPEKVNVHGGAVALGHPIGASGARVLTTLL